MEYGRLLRQHRAELTLNGLLDVESLASGSPIIDLYDRWKQGLTIRPGDFVVEPDTDDPMNWIIPNHHDRWAPKWSHRLRDYPVKIHGVNCALEYKYCLDTGNPVCHSIEQSFEGAERHYTRLLLPYNGKIVYAFRSLLPVWQ